MEERSWEKYSPEEKLIAIEAYLDGMVKLDDGDEAANGERLEWLRTHLPAYKPDGGKNYIFVSYSHRDYKDVYRDLAYFTYNSEKRVRFWYDEGLPIGQNWGQAAEKFLADANCVGVVFYLSKNLLLSPSVYEEIKLVQKYKKPYVAVAADGTYSAGAITAEQVGEKRLAVLRKFFPDENTALAYGKDFESALYRINKIGEAFNVTEEVLSDFICEETKGGLRLVEYRGNKTEVYIPEAINGKPVTEIQCDFPYAVKLFIPKTVKFIAVEKLENAGNLEEIKVDGNNEVYFDINGVLCLKDKNMLLRVPVQWSWRRQFGSKFFKITEKTEKYSKFIYPKIKKLKDGDNRTGYKTGLNGVTESEVHTIISLLRFFEAESFENADKEAYYTKFLEAYLNQGAAYKLYSEIRYKSIFNGVKGIAPRAFYGCKSAECIILPDSVAEIGGQAFKNSAVRTVYLPPSVRKIPVEAFCGCKLLAKVLTDTEYYFGNGETECGLNNAFLNNIDEIGTKAFCNTSLKSIFFGSPKIIGESAFFGCQRLTEIELPGSVITVPRGCFGECVRLNEVVLKDGVKMLDGKCFGGCVSLRTLNVPYSLSSVAENAFEGCDLTYAEYGGGRNEFIKLFKWSVFMLGEEEHYKVTAGFARTRIYCSDGEIE